MAKTTTAYVYTSTHATHGDAVKAAEIAHALGVRVSIAKTWRLSAGKHARAWRVTPVSR